MIERKLESKTLRSFSKSLVPMMVYVVITGALIGIEDFSSAAMVMAAESDSDVYGRGKQTAYRCLGTHRVDRGVQPW